MIDPFDPNNWERLLQHQFRMYAGSYADTECLVDEEDYHYFTRWKWVPKVNPGGKTYFKRAISRYDSDGQRTGADSVYLHVEILTRHEGPPPTRDRVIADHHNGNSSDNRRKNLRWVTKRHNNRNRFGRDYYQQAMHV